MRTARTVQRSRGRVPRMAHAARDDVRERRLPNLSPRSMPGEDGEIGSGSFTNVRSCPWIQTISTAATYLKSRLPVCSFASRPP